MLPSQSVLCPVDFSDASRGALRHAAALAEHFYADLTVLTVDDPFLTEAAEASFGAGWMKVQTRQALEKFVEEAGCAASRFRQLTLLVETGAPAAEILRVADETGAEIIVMSSHGVSGAQKLLFGSVTERVLRDTRLPVIVTPAADPGPARLEEWKSGLETILAPVDLSPWSAQQLRIAQGLVDAFDARLIVAHVLEPLRRRADDDRLAAYADARRRAHAHAQLSALIAALPARLRPTMTIGVGDPAAELARIAADTKADAVVMGLHSAPERGRRMGTVTYRLLCQAPVLVVAWPPHVGIRD